jgi:hypothetical protein
MSWKVNATKACYTTAAEATLNELDATRALRRRTRDWMDTQCASLRRWI